MDVQAGKSKCLFLHSHFGKYWSLEIYYYFSFFHFTFRRIKGLKWLPINEYTSMTGFSPNKILISTEDGKLLCMDITGKMFASMQIDTAINCIDSDGKIIVGGCSDGSVRAWTIQQGKFKELQRTVKAHAGAVTAIALGEHAESLTTTTTGSTIPPISEIMVTGSENCSTRVWRLAYEK